MKNSKFRTTFNDYQGMRSQVEDLLEKGKVNDTGKAESLLVFEALYRDIIDQGLSEDTPATIWKSRSLGNVNIKLSFEGAPYSPAGEVINTYAEKVDNSYYGGRNNITLLIKRSIFGSIRNNLIAFVLAYIAAYFIMNMVGSHEQEMIRSGLMGFEKLCTGLILSVGALVTFVSMLKNVMTMYVTGGGDPTLRSIHKRALTSSAMAVFLAFFMSILLTIFVIYTVFIDFVPAGETVTRDVIIHRSVGFSELMKALVSQDIADPFGTMNPIPIVLLVVLVAVAICISGSYFEKFLNVLDGLYVLFSKMLSVIMFAIPLVFFIATLEALLRKGFMVGFLAAASVIVVPVSMIAIIIFYAIRLKMAGVSPIAFAKRLPPLFKENFIINSSIDSAPYNMRYCMANYGMDKKKLEKYFPVLAQINLDGNCFIITAIAVMLMYSAGSGITWLDGLVVCFIIFFLSLGAPNQPGSILIGLLVVFHYVHTTDLMCLAIFSEVVFANLLSIINVVGDIVVMATIDKPRFEANDNPEDNPNE